MLPTLQRQAAGQRGAPEGPGKGSVRLGQKLSDLAGQATKGPGGAGGNQVLKHSRRSISPFDVLLHSCLEAARTPAVKPEHS